ncbi:MAG: 2-C-methyl-D-erythritol 4-phosphate cytidylyltransferase [Coriobacteriales bacterium]|jgi:2-C-methyl-D-erythritol 4-phosphate cytidylyltransferase|nr:2-C-methyl-D-erythritol 4-phosphate cytidylyltransferase [Coriobacteriales bacterium]
MNPALPFPTLLTEADRHALAAGLPAAAVAGPSVTAATAGLPAAATESATRPFAATPAALFGAEVAGARRDIHNKQTLRHNSGDPVVGPSVLAQPEFIAHRENLDSLASALLSLQGKVASTPHTAAVILAGGSGERYGRFGGKQTLEILGKPILTWSAEAFDAVADVGLIVVACPPERMEEYCRVAIDAFPFVTPVVMAPAGELRQESAFSALSMVPQEFELIAIHDGARPLVTPALIEHAIAAVRGSVDNDGAVVGYPAIDTLKIVSEQHIIGTPDRSAFWTAQTPQVFRAPILREAHRTALTEGFVGTDDSSLVERIGGKVALVQGPRDNIKITVPEDTVAVEAGLRKRRRG